jgi:predicted NAD/FAD-binding protein|tara:strand:- start:1800 stop:3044 length:1245 start_codon:yes stop_codon:yes gene_type:complete
MRIAIIGSGISGLTAAYLLNHDHEITLYEANDHIGGHTHTHDIEIEGKIWAVDSGFIVYNERTYPNFIRILDELGVERKPTRMGFSVKSVSNDLEYAGHSLDGLFSQRRNLIRPSFWRMIKSILRFKKESEEQLNELPLDMTIGSFLEKNHYPSEFIEHFIIPMGAAIWSTMPNMMTEIPAVFFIRFFQNHGILAIKDKPTWWVINGGSKNYVKKMTAGFTDRIMVSTPVKRVKRNDSIEIIAGSPQHMTRFDAVVFACHSDQALALLADPSYAENEILRAITYQRNDVLLHTDHSVLPRRRKAWSSWNYQLDSDPERPVALTYNMNILQGLESSVTFCVTLNDPQAVSPDRIIKEITYHHPLITVESISAQKRKNEISGVNNTYYCGAYWHNGFHEDGVVSAMDACELLAANL